MREVLSSVLLGEGACGAAGDRSPREDHLRAFRVADEPAPRGGVAARSSRTDTFLPLIFVLRSALITSLAALSGTSTSE
jgi:hypothetical protein